MSLYVQETMLKQEHVLALLVLMRGFKNQQI